MTTTVRMRDITDEDRERLLRQGQHGEEQRRAPHHHRNCEGRGGGESSVTRIRLSARNN